MNIQETLYKKKERNNSGFQFFQFRLDFCWMIFWFHGFPGESDISRGIHQHGIPADAATIRLVSTVRFYRGEWLVAEQGYLEPVLVDEFSMARDGICGNSNDLRIKRLKFLENICETNGLRAASWCIILGIEIQHEPLSLEILQGSFGSILILQRELWCRIANVWLWHDHSSFFFGVAISGERI